MWRRRRRGGGEGEQRRMRRRERGRRTEKNIKDVWVVDSQGYLSFFKNLLILMSHQYWAQKLEV